MTQLYIDNQEVALPEDFSFDLIRENPFFTKGGSFTLDISLNLDIPVNAKLYGHLNRFTASSKFKNRSARLIVDGRTVLNGTEIILEVNELSASVQLASGNSELNFLVGSDIKMSSIDLGDVPTISSEDAFWNYFKAYPEANFVCASVKAMNGSESIFINNLRSHHIRYSEGKFKLYTTEKFPEEIRPMPYLNYIIERCIKALGYTIKNNSIRKSIYNRLFIVHGNKPQKVNELMPDKTVAEFLSEVEELLDVLIQVNEDKTVDIIFAYEFYNDPALFTPKKVSEQFERKYLNPDEQPASHTSSNIRYDFEDTEISKESDIDPGVRNSLKEVICENLDSVNAALHVMNAEAIMRSIFIDKETGQEFIAKKNGEGGYDFKLWPVNTFKRISKKTGENIEIEIIPADIEVLEVDVCHTIGWYNYTGYIQIPVAASFVGTTEETITAEEAIQGKTATSQKLDKIAVAFCGSAGYYIFPKGEETTTEPDIFYHAVYPALLTHYNAPWVNSVYYPLDKDHATLAFNSEGFGLYERIYSKTPAIDTEVETTMHAILDGVIPSAKDVFIVNNKKCVCKDIHFKITPDGFDPEYQATLYTMK